MSSPRSETNPSALPPDALRTWGAYIRRTLGTAPGPPQDRPQEYPQAAGVPGPTTRQRRPYKGRRSALASAGRRSNGRCHHHPKPAPFSLTITPSRLCSPPDRLPTCVHTVDLGRCIVFLSCRYPLVHGPLVPLLPSTPHHLLLILPTSAAALLLATQRTLPYPASDRHRRSCTRASKEDGLGGHEDCSAL